MGVGQPSVQRNQTDFCANANQNRQKSGLQKHRGLVWRDTLKACPGIVITSGLSHRPEQNQEAEERNRGSGKSQNSVLPGCLQCLPIALEADQQNGQQGREFNGQLGHAGANNHRNRQH